ncbi:DUF4037 domain-containing protein [Planctomonas sp. JC2975]|uniref:DUF4037 domain-containing protein n=1 Tax=Planctomonas sp. JC2975 TaxID=2729626 RepID=UPI001474390A|nr:DUF4037 domain-containing protein [Planctomonas sp. JC2975]NNC12685.1 DUF4037 domain-containing protein [Planctomonas sp. JC2975]
MPTSSASSGVDLSSAYYDEVVAPLLAERFPRMPHTAGRVGAGSDVLGLDDATSRDHDWGLRLSLFVPQEDVRAVDDALSEELPALFHGLPTRFAFTGQTVDRHHVDVTTVAGFLDAHLGFDPRASLSVDQWLSLSGQAVLEVVAGPVFADDSGDFAAARAVLEWYPDDVWRYVLACDWARLAQELPLMSRAGDVGDDRGSRIIAGRLAHVVMHLAFLLERRWPPYAKWFGTMFRQLSCSAEVGASVDRALQADAWQDRQLALGDAMRALATVQNGLGLTDVQQAAIPFWDRPYVHPDPDIERQLLAGIRDPKVRALPRGRGSVEQRTDNVDVLVDLVARRALVREL